MYINLHEVVDKAKTKSWTRRKRLREQGEFRNEFVDKAKNGFVDKAKTDSWTGESRNGFADKAKTDSWTRLNGLAFRVSALVSAIGFRQTA